MTGTDWRAAGTAVVLALLLFSLLAPLGAGRAGTAPVLTLAFSERTSSHIVPEPIAPAAGGMAGAGASRGGAPSSETATGVPAPSTSSSGWQSANFFSDVSVNVYGSGLPLGFRTVPYTNALPISTLGFWVNITATAPILFANLTIWGNQWPGINTSGTISGFSPTNPAVRPMVVNAHDSAQASYYFDNYRYFWPGSTVSFNLTVVGLNSTPSEVKSASNLSVVENYPGGFQDAATWIFQVATPWASSNFSDDIGISTTPDVMGPVVYAPNPDQTLMVDLRSIPFDGAATPIPAALLDFTVDLNGTVNTYSEPFGPLNHTAMSIEQAIGPYPGASVSFNVTAWLPWEGGAIDRVTSPVTTFTWSANGGWWYPQQGLSSNLALGISPSLTATATASAPVETLPTDAPVDLTLHEPIQNITIGSAELVYHFSDNGADLAGSLPFRPVTDNTSALTVPGLPAGGSLTFYLVAKDIYGRSVASGNFSYTEAGPTSPPLPSEEGLVFAEVIDLSTSALVANFTYQISNATWSTSGPASPMGIAQAYLPGTSQPVQLGFGTYGVEIRALGAVQRAIVTLSPQNPVPVIVFYVESHPLTTVSAQEPASDVPILAAGGLVGAALIALPLLRWFDERKARAEEEQLRVTL